MAELPELCYAFHPEHRAEEGRVILIKRGEKGYWSVAPRDPRAANEAQIPPVTPQQAAATLTGSMWGWDAHGADPTQWTEQSDA